MKPLRGDVDQEFDVPLFRDKARTVCLMLALERTYMARLQWAGQVSDGGPGESGTG